jgi:hypothetical protein
MSHNNHILGLVGRGRSVGRSGCSLVGGSRTVVRSGGSLVGGRSSVLGNTLVLHISNISGLGVNHGVGDDLGPAVGKGNPVGSAGGVTVALLVLAKVHLGVVVSNSITEVVRGGLVVLVLVVGRPGGIGDRLGGIGNGSWGIGRTGIVGTSDGHKGSAERAINSVPTTGRGSGIVLPRADRPRGRQLGRAQIGR